MYKKYKKFHKEMCRTSHKYMKCHKCLLTLLIIGVERGRTKNAFKRLAKPPKIVLQNRKGGLMK